MIALLAAGALTAAACDDDGSSGPSASQTFDASAVYPDTVAAGPMRVAIDVLIKVPRGVSEPQAFSGEGVLDPGESTSAMTFDFSGILAGSLGYLEETAAVFDGQVFYVHVPALADLLDDPDPWIEFDLSDAKLLEVADIGHLKQLRYNDPTQLIEYLRGVVVLEREGEEEVGGTQTSRYRVLIDLDEAAATEGASEVLDQLAGEVEPSPLVGEVWIDPDGVVRRLSFKQTFPLVPGGPNDIRVSTTMELSDFGADAAVEIPDPEHVTDLTELIDR